MTAIPTPRRPILLTLVLSAALWGQSPPPDEVTALMAKVANWQLAHGNPHAPLDWTTGAYTAGLAAWAAMSEDPVYERALLRIGRDNGWQLGPRRYMADDHVIGQMYLALYRRHQDPAMIAQIRRRFDWILAHPPQSSLDYHQRTDQDRYWWCDSLFMGPPVWAELAAATGNRSYLDFMDREWWACTDFLYDRDEHLYYRDSRFFDQRAENGAKLFWCRGNGWVFAGLAKVLQAMPLDYPSRQRYLTLYREMAEKLVAIQGADGLWRSSLLDPVNFPPPEASGSAFFCYGLAWGVNRGLLPVVPYREAALKAWQGLAQCVHPDGKLGWVQPIGAAPGHVTADLTEIYGVGAFLLAGSEVYKMALLGDRTVARVVTENPLAVFRSSESLEIPWTGPAPVVLVDVSNRPTRCQPLDPDGDGTPDRLLFQADFAPGQVRWFWLAEPGDTLTAPEEDRRTYGRFVPERYGDFAWENDRIAYRMYSKALEFETVSSGIDVWVKRVPYPVIDKWYAGDDYHEDHGEGLDYYKVGPSRGCGGLAVLAGDELFTSRNFVQARVLANGPLRTVFELDYEPWQAGDTTIRETKRISLDLGLPFNRIEAHLRADRPLTVALGIVLRDGGDVWYDPSRAALSYWEPADPNHGHTGCAVIAGQPSRLLQRDGHVFLVGQASGRAPLTYYAGACWDRGGPYRSAEQWADAVADFAERLAHPVVIHLER